MGRVIGEPSEGFGASSDKIRVVQDQTFDVEPEDHGYLISEQFGGDWAATLPKLDRVQPGFSVRLLYRENDNSKGTIQPYADEKIGSEDNLLVYGKGSVVMTKLNGNWFVESQVSYDFLPQQGKAKLYQFESKSHVTVEHDLGYIPLVEVWIETEGEFINSNVDISHDWDNKNSFTLELGSDYNGKIIYI